MIPPQEWVHGSPPRARASWVGARSGEPGHLERLPGEADGLASGSPENRDAVLCGQWPAHVPRGRGRVLGQTQMHTARPHPGPRQRAASSADPQAPALGLLPSRPVVCLHQSPFPAWLRQWSMMLPLKEVQNKREEVLKTWRVLFSHSIQCFSN